MEKLISIVIPVKDEKKIIARCIESVLKALEGLKNYEVMLVDSCSVDKTVEIAKKYPIRILRLQKHWPKSPFRGEIHWNKKQYWQVCSFFGWGYDP